MTVRTFRVHRDFPMEITEQLRKKDNDETLEYDFLISWLGNEHGFLLQFKANREWLAILNKFDTCWSPLPSTPSPLQPPNVDSSIPHVPASDSEKRPQFESATGV